MFRHRGVDDFRSNSYNANSMRSQFSSQTSGQRIDRCFCRAVGHRAASATGVSYVGTYVDDDPVALLNHPSRGRSTIEEYAAGIDAPHPLNQLVTTVDNECTLLHPLASVIDQVIKAISEGAGQFGEHAVHVSGLAYIGLNGDGFSAGRLDFLDGCVGRGLVTTVVDAYLGASTI